MITREKPMPALLKSAPEADILVVDDSPDNLRLLAHILETHGYFVRKARSGKMALQSVLREQPDLILLDINMPEMDGYEVCRQLKKSATTAHIPVIFISAFDQVNHKIKGFEVGGQDYITKPFQELEVVARIKNQLLIQHQRRQLKQEIQERQIAEAEVRRLNADLEQQVQVRTLELQQALKFETTLKRISDKVRDSLDPHQILQNAVEELAIALEVYYCDAVLYSPDQPSSTLHYQYLASDSEPAEAQLLHSSDVLNAYDQLQQQRFCFSFCQLQPLQFRDYHAILACPIFDDQVDQTGILGSLWLFKRTPSSFSELEIHLVQQVANQCAIGLRQAKLYEAAQAQVQELERLNRLKDDFLSTISHELRSPIANMKMVLKLLTTLTDQGRSFVESLSQSLTPDSKVSHYFKVLQEECDRELALVEDLLSLQYIEAGNYTNQPTAIDLPELVRYLTEPFESRTQDHQQTLQVIVAPTLSMVNLDVYCLKRIITELLSNACKYTPASGTISLSVDLVGNAMAIGVAPSLQLAVTNTGTEIPSEELPRIFNKFYRIPNNDPWKHGGTGLGLALVKKLVEQMGGEITVSSQNQTTCFTVQLPLSGMDGQSG